MKDGELAFVFVLIELVGVTQFSSLEDDRLTEGALKSAFTVIDSKSKQLLFSDALMTYVPAAATLTVDKVVPPLIVPLVVDQL